MTWNGRVTVHDDLSRLHASTRAGDTSREIGYSSVTQGEGSLDLITESGAVRAQIGDQPDGRFGVSIWHRGQLRFIPDLIQELQDEDVALSNRISGLGDRMVSAEGRLDGHDSTLATHNTRISGLGDRMVSAEGTLSSHNTRIGNAQSRADAAHSNAATAQARADSAWTRAGTGIANAATAQARADAAYALAAGASTPGDMNDLIDAINARLGALRTWFAAAKDGDPSLPDVPGLPNIPR